MATGKQIAANRQNAKSSTGPRTNYGKRRSRRNAIRHGLTAETIIDVLEDPIAYKALQRAIHNDYHPRSNFELQLVGRLVSLLWRLRRATAIESSMLATQAATHRKERVARDQTIDREKLNPFYELIPTLTPRARTEFESEGSKQKSVRKSLHDLVPHQNDCRLNIAQAFMELSRGDRSVLERLGQYETRLWRQTLQTILLLNALNANSDEYTNPRRTFSNFGLSAKRHRHIHWPPIDLPR
jgi:hypothetical protein